jgi:hypothetical protein
MNAQDRNLTLNPLHDGECRFEAVYDEYGWFDRWKFIECKCKEGERYCESPEAQGLLPSEDKEKNIIDTNCIPTSSSDLTGLQKGKKAEQVFLRWPVIECLKHTYFASNRWNQQFMDIGPVGYGKIERDEWIIRVEKLHPSRPRVAVVPTLQPTRGLKQEDGDIAVAVLVGLPELQVPGGTETAMEYYWLTTSNHCLDADRRAFVIMITQGWLVEISRPILSERQKEID